MIGAAALLWLGKQPQSAPLTASTENASIESASDQNADSPAALALLKRSTLADNTLSYSALSQTVAFMGGHSLTSNAKITRAPRHLSIETLSGADKGARSGYSQRWFWRRDAGKSLVPYAEVKLPADEMAAKRLPLLIENYRVTFGATKKVDGRTAQAVEMRPKRSIDGAKGPARRLWVDQQTGLTLGIESFNCDLQPTSRSSLSKLQIAPAVTAVTLASFERPTAIFASLSTQNWQGEELGDDFIAASAKTGFAPPKPTFLPPGFKLDGYGVHRCRTTGTLQPAAFSRYCDGINTLTVFAFRPVNENIAKNMRGGCNFGPGALSSRESNGGRLVAIGDLPAKTLAKVLASAQFEMAR